MADTRRSSRLRWRCRRGMRELDVLLERFLEQESAALDRGSWAGLEALLDCEDDVLWDWLQAPHAAGAGVHSDLLERIRRGHP